MWKSMNLIVLLCLNIGKRLFVFGIVWDGWYDIERGNYYDCVYLKIWYMVLYLCKYI